MSSLRMSFQSLLCVCLLASICGISNFASAATSIINATLHNDQNETILEVQDVNTLAIPNRFNQKWIKFDITYYTVRRIEQTNGSHWILYMYDNTKLELSLLEHDNHTTEYSFTWHLADISKYLREVCFHYGPHNGQGAFWYNGYQSRTPSWPMNPEKAYPQQQFNYLFDYERYFNSSQTKDAILVLEHLFVNSDGFALWFDHQQPLYVARKLSHDSPRKVPYLCLSVKNEVTYPYTLVDKDHLKLKFSIFVSSNVRNVTDYVVHQSGRIQRPNKVPNTAMMHNPSWLMWESGYQFIGDEATRSFSKQILDHPIVPKGKLIMNTVNSLLLVKLSEVNAFPNLTLSSYLHSNNLDIGLQIGTAAMHQEEAPLCSKYCVKGTNLIDFSIENARKLYTTKLNYLKYEKEIDIFWFVGDQLYKNLELNDAIVRQYPSLLTTRYLEALAEADATVVTEYAFRSQHLPIWTRLTNYVHTPADQLLEQLIPNVLSASMAGYSFVLPYSIGGFTYQGQPSEEIYIRMLQATALMPVMSFAKEPWKYSNETMALTKEYLDLHTKYVPLMIELAEKRVRDGSPIIRPMWYEAPQDERTFAIGDQFMLGEHIVVAPVLKANERTRLVYLPSGRWTDQHGVEYIGGTEYLVVAPLHQLPFFTRKH